MDPVVRDHLHDRMPVPSSRPAAAAVDGHDSRRSKSRQLRRLEEYRKLKAIVPSLKSVRKAKKVTIINEAVKYIDQLHADLMAKILQGKMPGLSHLNREHLDLVRS